MSMMERTPGRPRDAAVDASLLAATQDLLLEQGYDRLSLEAVASRAGVGKPAIYRRWSGKSALTVAAVLDLTPVPPLPDEGSLRADLLACARTYQQSERTHKVLAGLMTAMVHNDELRAAASQAIGMPFQHLFEQVITRAKERGEVTGPDNTAIVAGLFPALAFHRGAALGLPIDDAFILQTVDQCLLPLLRQRG